MVNPTDELNKTSPHGSTEHLPQANSEDPETLRAQIERNRAQMGQTIDEIQARLSPAYLKQQTQETIRETITEKVDHMTHEAEYQARRIRRSTVNTIKENPVPVAMIGIGLGWLLLKSNENDHSFDHEREERYALAGDPYYGSYPPEYRGVYYEEDRSAVDRATGQAKDWTEDKVQAAREKASSVASQVQEMGEDVAQSAQETASELAREARVRKDSAAHTVSRQASETAEHTRQTAREIQQTARRQARRTKRSVLDTFYENPLAVGAAAVAAGALVGMALPSTQKENELMGETRDQLVEEARATAQQSAQQLQSIAEQAGEAAAAEAKREAERQNMDISTTESKSRSRSTETTTTTG